MLAHLTEIFGGRAWTLHSDFTAASALQEMLRFQGVVMSNPPPAVRLLGDDHPTTKERAFHHSTVIERT